MTGADITPPASGLGRAMGALGALGGLASTISEFLPTTTTANFSGQTNKQTQQTMLTEEGMQRMLNLLMQGSGGLQETVSGERTVGLFNSTVNQQLVGDLMARAAGEVAMRAAPVVTDTVMGPTTTKTKAKKCFITTAVCQRLGRPDDCIELETLRAFRNQYVLQYHPKDVISYYTHAPKVVEALDKLPGAVEIYNRFDWKYIQPAVAAINTGNFEEAYQIYKKLFANARELAGV